MVGVEGLRHQMRQARLTAGTVGENLVVVPEDIPVAVEEGSLLVVEVGSLAVAGEGSCCCHDSRTKVLAEGRGCTVVDDHLVVESPSRTSPGVEAAAVRKTGLKCVHAIVAAGAVADSLIGYHDNSSPKVEDLAVGHSN